MPNKKDTNIGGHKFGKLTPTGVARINPKGIPMWACKCDCGNTSIVSVYSLLSGTSTSCGCGRIEKITKHGLSRSKIYNSWYAMKYRTSGKAGEKDKYYSGRGIKIEDERWKDILLFKEDMGSRPEGKTIDRVDVNGGYSKDNARWADATEQARNRRNNRKITVDGVEQLVVNLVEKYNINPIVVLNRLDLGWDPVKALTAPVRKKRKSLHWLRKAQ